MLRRAPVARLFNAYVFARWSAASKPTVGADAIHIGVLKRDVRFRLAYEVQTAATRAKAEAALAALLDDRARHRERTLLLVDFPLSFPAGLAERLKLKGEPPWRAVWDQLGRMVKDKADNTNNRFGVGSEINRRLTGGPFPFWGCPPRDALTTLAAKRGRDHGADDLPEFRGFETATGAANPAWKLYYAAPMGALAILGIPMMARLKARFGEAMRVWPLETGFKALAEADLAGVAVVAAEVGPNLPAAAAQPGEAAGAARTRGLLEQLARLDETGRLAPLFAPPKSAESAAVAHGEREEGWGLVL